MYVWIIERWMGSLSFWSNLSTYFLRSITGRLSMPTSQQLITCNSRKLDNAFQICGGSQTYIDLPSGSLPLLEITKFDLRISVFKGYIFPCKIFRSFTGEYLLEHVGTEAPKGAIQDIKRFSHALHHFVPFKRWKIKGWQCTIRRLPTQKISEIDRLRLVNWIT